MKLKLLFFASIFICFSYCFSHDKTHLEFTNISFNDESRTLNFQIENHLLHDYNHLQVNLIVNDSLLESNIIDFISSKQKTVSSSFFINKTIKIIEKTANLKVKKICRV